MSERVCEWCRYEDALQRGGEAVYSMDLVEGVFWIRRVR